MELLRYFLPAAEENYSMKSQQNLPDNISLRYYLLTRKASNIFVAAVFSFAGGELPSGVLLVRFRLR